MKAYLSDKDYQFMFTRVPRICVDLVITSPKGILLTKRSIEPNLGMWNLPGGRIMIHETINDAVKRIAKDELNLTVRKNHLIGYIELFNEIRNNTKQHSLSLIFKVKIISGAIEKNSQAEDIQFFSKLPNNTVPEQHSFLTKNKCL